MDSQLTVRLPDDLRKALDRVGRKTGLKNSEIVRLALRQYLNVPASSNRHPAERVRGLLGSLETGVPDLAEKHREYVLESLRRGQ
ncbi:MAG: ribbon-helix-helix protein, CopG family [Acidiferrobacterales bacterium]